MELLKLNDKGEEITRMSNEEIENISGGFEIVNEPIYKLDSDEIKSLTFFSYTLEKIEDGKFKIKDMDGKVADPKKVQLICEKSKDADPLKKLPRALGWCEGDHEKSRRPHWWH